MEVRIFVTVLGFVIGACLGSLVKVLAERSLTKESFFGRSHCNFCKKDLAWYDLIPFFSFLFLQGKCRYCHKKLSKEYFLVELVFAVLTAGLFFTGGFPAPIEGWDLWVRISSLTFKVFVLCVLGIVFLTDLKKSLIPDRITYPAIVIALVALVGMTIHRIVILYLALSQDPVGKYLMPPYNDYFQRHVYYNLEPLFGSIIMGVVIGLFFLVLILVTKGRGMGGGDLKLGVFLGVAFGFPGSLLVLMLAFLLGSVVGIGLLLLKKKQFGQTIPFGPFLALGGVIALFWGSQIINWYLQLRIN